jgi:hypothetical protein
MYLVTWHGITNLYVYDWSLYLILHARLQWFISYVEMLSMV